MTLDLERGQLTDRKPPFKYSAIDRVGFSDTDAQGIVYYGRYLAFFDLARVEYHRHLGLMHAERRPQEFVMRACTMDYLAPARFDDLVETAAVLCSVETYLRITHRDGWSVDAYRAWCRRVLTETVFFSPQST